MRGYYGCESTRHSEFTCLTYFYVNRKFTEDMWCQPCVNRFVIGDNNENV